MLGQEGYGAVSTMRQARERHRFSVADYHKLGEAGILTADDRAELLDGEIVDRSPIGSLHAGTVEMIADRLRQLCGGRARKLPLYARAGIREVWLVDLPGRRVEVYRDPANGRYGTVRHALPGEMLAPRALPGAGLPVADLLPAPGQS